MRKLLVVVDMQNDFIDGSLGTPSAQSVVQKVADKIKAWNGDVVFTLDTHNDDYLLSQEGRKLPVSHCIKGTHGHALNEDIFNAVVFKQGNNPYINSLRKGTFGSTALPELIRFTEINHVELVGVCTDICVISNALLLKSALPEIEISVDAACCAGTTEENHLAALRVMKSCQIDVINE